jgi:hypothetical protein
VELLASGSSLEGFGSVVGWTVVLVLLALGGLSLMLWVRRWMRRESASPEPFTLHDIRGMRDRGEISDHEFQAMRGALLAAHTNAVRGDRRGADSRSAYTGDRRDDPAGLDGDVTDADAGGDSGGLRDGY